jgi:osmotically-inducible protein OsmY
MSLTRSSSKEEIRKRVPERERFLRRIPLDRVRERMPVTGHGSARRAGSAGRRAAATAATSTGRRVTAAWGATMGAAKSIRRRSDRGRRTLGRRLGAAAAATGATAAGAYFLNPREGKRRRHMARDRVTAFFRRGARRARRQAEYRKGQVEGVVEGARSRMEPEKPAPNDQALAERVQSEIFRPADAPKDSVNVNVENAVVYLRGEVKRPKDIEKLIEAARSVEGVRGVESLLHTPKTQAPMKQNGKGSRARKQTA